MICIFGLYHVLRIRAEEEIRLSVFAVGGWEIRQYREDGSCVKDMFAERMRMSL